MDDLFEIRTDIKTLLVSSARQGEKIEELTKAFAAYVRPCEKLEEHLAEHEEIKQEGKGAVKWALTTILAPLLAAISAFLAAKFGFPKS